MAFPIFTYNYRIFYKNEGTEGWTDESFDVHGGWELHPEKERQIVLRAAELREQGFTVLGIFKECTSNLVL